MLEIMLPLLIAMEKQKLIFIRNFLLKTFLIGLLITIFFFVMTVNFWDIGSSFLLSKFLINEKDLGELTGKFFLSARFFLFYILLAPTLALHWMIKTKDY